jgi:hypothetical protein
MQQKMIAYLDKFAIYFILNFKNYPADFVKLVIIAY